MSIDDFEEFDDMDMDMDSDSGGMDFDLDEDSPPEESGNRTFIIVAGILGAITVLALVCIAAYAFVVLPRQRAENEARDAETIAYQFANSSCCCTHNYVCSSWRPTYSHRISVINSGCHCHPNCDSYEHRITFHRLCRGCRCSRSAWYGSFIDCCDIPG
jgi:hypothetical protein